ncbi:MAG: hypothetical protein Kow0031_24640 [Anaerolineae bacterium]
MTTDSAPNKFDRLFERVLLALALLLGLVGVGLLAVNFWPRAEQPVPKLHSFTGPTAVIVDQLGEDYPNPEFIGQATTLLEQAGYNVVLVPAQEVTVDFYRYLPAQNFDIVLLRNHASASVVNDAGETVTEDSVSLSTSEPVSDKYPRECNARRLGAFEPDGKDELYFSIRWDFFAHDAVGSFNDTVIVMMGCEGLRADKTAQTLLGRGASAIIGWSDLVTAPHMDTATLYLLEQWLAEDKSLVEAVAATRVNIGNDPQFTSTELQIVQ